MLSQYYTWDVHLALWFSTHFGPIERRRSYARPSRRQSINPNRPTAGYRVSREDLENRTFGLILDTPELFNQDILDTVLNVLTLHSIAHDIPQVRLLYCDAKTYDLGFVAPDQLQTMIDIKGLGQKIPLQSSVDLLEKAYDFPKNVPIILISDALNNTLDIKREHAYILANDEEISLIEKKATQ